MKERYLLTGLVFFLAVILVIPSISFARGEREYEAKQIPNIKIDGNLEEWAEWVEPDIILLTEVFGDVAPEPDDFTGSVMVAWSEDDPSRIYFAVKILDDEFQPEGDQPWWTDSMEFIFDSDNNGTADQFTLGQDGELTHASATPDNSEWVVTNKREEEFTWEVAINPAAGFKAGVGDAIGLALSYNDSENGVREHQIRWIAQENAWSAAANQGELIFSAEIMKPAPVEPLGKLATTWGSIK